MSRQRSKGKKRPRRWHRGAAEAQVWARTRLPQVDSGADPTAGRPGPLRRVGNRNRGDVA